MDKEKIRELEAKRSAQSGVFFIIQNKESKEKSEVNFKNIVAAQKEQVYKK